MTLRLRALGFAHSYVGTKEHPPDSNRGPLIDKWNKDAGVPVGSFWCMSFVHGMYLLAGKDLPGHALVQSFDYWATAAGDVVARPLRGDIVCYDWNQDHWDDHVGIVDKVLALRWRGKTFVGWIRTVEGNTAVGNDSNGGEVMIRYRWIRGFSAKFCRVPG